MKTARQTRSTVAMLLPGCAMLVALETWCILKPCFVSWAFRNPTSTPASWEKRLVTFLANAVGGLVDGGAQVSSIRNMGLHAPKMFGGWKGFVPARATVPFCLFFASPSSMARTFPKSFPIDDFLNDGKAPTIGENSLQWAALLTARSHPAGASARVNNGYSCSAGVGAFGNCLHWSQSRKEGHPQNDFDKQCSVSTFWAHQQRHDSKFLHAWLLVAGALRSVRTHVFRRFGVRGWFSFDRWILTGWDLWKTGCSGFSSLLICRRFDELIYNHHFI